MSAEIKYCIEIDDNGLLQQKITFRGCDRELSQIGFKDLLTMEKGLRVRNTSKLNWKRDFLGIKFPHRVINCEKLQNDKMCRSCTIGRKLNCFDCKICTSCDKCSKRITQVKFYSTEVNKWKRQSPDEKGYMSPHYVGEAIVKGEETDQTQVRFGKCNKCFVELNHDRYNENNRICRRSYNDSRKKIEMFDNFLIVVS